MITSKWIASRLFRLPDGPAPLFSLAGLPVAIILALILTWPVVATGHFIGFSDTNSYVKGGDAIWRIVSKELFTTDIPVASHTKADNAIVAEGKTSSLGDKENLYGRSITYAALFAGVVRTAGPLAMNFLQALMIAFAILAMIERPALQRPGLLATGFIMLIATSQVAWLSVYLMPDVLGAIALIFAALLVARFDKFSSGQKLFLTALAAFAVSAHYGNIPIAFATVGAALLWRHFIRQPGGSVRKGGSVVAAGLFLILAAPLLNMVASYAVLGEASMTPLRPPVVLARSLEDGPARWYLEKQCTENPSAYCAAFDKELVDNHYDFLWGQDKGLDKRNADAVQSVRENEWQIVFSAMLEYPLQQFAAIARNTAKQFILVGQVGYSMDWNGSKFVMSGTVKLRHIANQIMIGITVVSGALLAGLLFSGRLTHPQVQILVIITFGLIINAFVFGALSAPADRYQARVAWLLPLLLLLFIAENGFRGGRRLETTQT